MKSHNWRQVWQRSEAAEHLVGWAGVVVWEFHPETVLVTWRVSIGEEWARPTSRGGPWELLCWRNSRMEPAPVECAGVLPSESCWFSIETYVQACVQHKGIWVLEKKVCAWRARCGFRARVGESWAWGTAERGLWRVAKSGLCWLKLTRGRRPVHVAVVYLLGYVI